VTWTLWGKKGGEKKSAGGEIESELINFVEKKRECLAGGLGNRNERTPEISYWRVKAGVLWG